MTWLGQMGYKAAFWLLIGLEFAPHVRRIIDAGMTKLLGVE